MMKDPYLVPVMNREKIKTKEITVTVPGSKSITNRALLLAMLSDGESTLSGVLFSDDSRHFIDCLKALLFETDIREEEKSAVIRGLCGALPCREASLNVGSAGTAARFLSAVLGISKGTFHMDASKQMKKRPMAPLLDALRELGCTISFSGEENHFPFTLHGCGFGKNEITVDIDKSSQFLSALLIASPLAGKDFTVHTVGSHGMAYIAMTVKMMEQFGVKVHTPDAHTFFIPAGQHYKPLAYAIEPDVSAACYFYALGALLGVRVLIPGVHKHSLQGDIRFLELLSEMGCDLEERPEGIALCGPADKKLRGIHADMSACSDQAITMAAIAPYADSPVTITGIGHIRHQESDRIAAIAENLAAMGIRSEVGEDCITIYPGTPEPAQIKTHDDHRLAMGFSITGLLAEGILIEDPGCCRKTFENYFEVLDDVLSRLQ